jgi:hypothetical protein
MSILGHHFIDGRRSDCASNTPLFRLDAPAGAAVRAVRIEEAAS